MRRYVTTVLQRESQEISVVCLNIGGRNTNPIEFFMEGDNSEAGLQATELRLRAQEAMVDPAHGPLAMPSAERDVVDRILASIYGATLAVFVDDQSEGKAETRAFLDRRIDGVMKFEKVKAKWLNPDRETFSVSRFLGRLRYPAR